MPCTVLWQIERKELFTSFRMQIAQPCERCQKALYKVHWSTQFCITTSNITKWHAAETCQINQNTHTDAYTRVHTSVTHAHKYVWSDILRNCASHWYIIVYVYPNFSVKLITITLSEIYHLKIPANPEQFQSQRKFQTLEVQSVKTVAR